MKTRLTCKVYCCNALYFLRSLEDSGEKVDMFMTDPMSTYDMEFNMKWLRICYSLLKRGRILCSFCSPPTVEGFISQAKDTGFKLVQKFERKNKLTGKMEPCIVLSKRKSRFKPFKYRHFSLKSPKLGSFPREAMKPLGLIKSLVRHFTNEGDIVIDHFLGSGTTAIACVQTKRNFKGCELNEDYAVIAKKRLGFKDMFRTGL